MRRFRVRFPLRPPAPYWLGRCQYNVTGWDRRHGLHTLSRVWQHVKLSDVSLGTHPRCTLVVDEDVKTPNKPNQTKPSCLSVKMPQKVSVPLSSTKAGDVNSPVRMPILLILLHFYFNHAIVANIFVRFFL